MLARASPDFTPVDTAADDPAMMIYTSGTTGQPKGALHAHRVLLGHLPGIELPHFPFPQAGDRYWTPADWAWAGGLLDALLPEPALRRAGGGRTNSTNSIRSDAFALMAQTQVRNAFIPPTALRMMRAVPNPRGRYDFKLRSVASGGESLGVEALEWGKKPSASPSTNSTARPNAIWCSAPARSSACSRPAPSASRFRATPSR